MKRILNSKYITFVLLILLLVWYIPNYQKGIDVTDTSYSLVNYKYFFEGNNTVDFSRLFTNLTGAVLYKIIPKNQYFIFSIINAVIFIVGCIFIIRLFKEYLSLNARLLIALISCFFGLSNIHIYNYNTTTFFFLILSIYFLLKGLRDDGDYKYIFLSSLTASINVFFRFPNILFFINVISIVYDGFIKEKNKSSMFKELLMYLLGTLSGLILCSIICLCIVDFEIVSSSISNMFNTFIGNDHSNMDYSLFQTIIHLTKQLGKTYINFSPVLLFVIITAFLLNKYTKNKKISKQIIYTLFGLILFLYSFLMFNLTYYTWTIIIIISLTISIYNCINCSVNKDLKVISFINVCTLIVLPIGTDVGCLYYIYFICFPLMVLISSLNKLEINDCHINTKGIITTILIYCLLSSYTFSRNYVYRDGNYDKLTENVFCDELLLMKTTNEKKQYIENVYNILMPYNNEKYEILCLGDFNIVPLITNIKPYLSCCWPDLNNYNYNDFEREIDEKITYKKPIILLSPIFSSHIEDDADSQYNKKLDKIFEIIKKYDYIKLFENNELIIYCSE